MAFEDILQDIHGNGKFLTQLKILFTIPVAMIVSWIWMGVFFMVSIPDHWCNVPAVQNSNLSIMEQRSLISPPGDPSCTMYDLDYKSVLDGKNVTYLNDTKVISCNNGWQYDKTDYEETVVSKWDIVCDRSHYLSLVLTTQKIGNFFGTPVLVFLSDKIGRKSVLLIVAIVVTATETISVLLKNLTAFIVIRILASTVLSASVTLLCIFCIELVPPEHRAYMTGVINIAWTVGLTIQILFAYLTRHWIALALINASAGFLILCFWKFLPESPCWLVSQGRYEDAALVLKRIGDKNGKNPDTAVLFKKLQALGDDIKKIKDGETHSKFNLLKYPRLRKHFILLTLSWIANNTGYGGLIYNVRNLYGNEFINYFLLAVVEVPGNIAFMILMDRCGRRWTSSVGFFVSGMMCLLPATGLPYTDIIASIGGKFLFSGNFMVTDQQASELYPTVTRTVGIGACKTISTAVTLSLPYLADLSIYGKELPFVIISLICFFTGIAVSFLPETLNENLPQTTTEAEDFGKDQKYFSWKRKKIAPVDISTPTS